MTLPRGTAALAELDRLYVCPCSRRITSIFATALQNAASVSTLLLTSDALIAEKPKDSPKKGGGGGHGGDYDMY